MPAPPVAFKETIRRTAIGERKYIRYFDGRGHFAHLKLQLLPHAGEGCVITSATELSIPDDCYREVWSAILRKLNSGPVAHLPMHGVEVRVIAGTHLPKFSYPEAFGIVACMAFDEAMLSASPIVVEPWICMRMRLDAGSISEAFTMLTRLLGRVQTSVSVSDSFFLEVEIPQRIVSRIRVALNLPESKVFCMPATSEYRQLYAAMPEPDHRRPPFQDWT